MKWIGALLLIATTTWIGFYISHQLSLRTKQLRALIYSIELIEAEMVYSQHSLQNIFLHVKEKTTEPLQTFYSRLAEALTGTVSDFVTLWNQEVTNLKSQSAFKQNEIDILTQFGKNIGHHHLLQQQKQIKLTSHYLQQELSEAMVQKSKYEKVAKSMGVLVGIFIVLILM